MKTAKEWFELLPDEVRKKAIQNTKKYRLGVIFSSLRGAIWVVLDGMKHQKEFRIGEEYQKEHERTHNEA